MKREGTKTRESFSACLRALRFACRGGASVAGGRACRAHALLGKTGEDLACAELEAPRVCNSCAGGYRRRGGELDIVARDGPTLVFVEVKAREGHAFGDGGEAVTALKRRRIVRLALDYMMRHRLTECPCRFDVVSIHFDGDRIEVSRTLSIVDRTRFRATA